MSSGEKSLIVWLNPFFADSMSVETGNDWAAGADVPTARPGTKDNPYGVRSIHQLQFINWNHEEQNTTTALVNHPRNSRNEDEFMFLSYVRTSNGQAAGARVDRVYCWLQTHDLDGSEVMDYTPIAAFTDGNPEVNGGTAQIYGWFGGSYNGNDYTIQNLNISTESINTTGLFGLTINADLRNIILYAPNGDGEIKATNSSHNWYAMGGLVGLAANTSGSTQTISNCAVAGYEIWDNNRYVAHGGGGVGGLVGICNMALENCTAVTDIHLNFTHNITSGVRNIRIGGLVGSCQKSISKCYAGGSIQVEEKSKNCNVSVYTGGIAGGYFMKQLNVNGSTVGAADSDNATITNCYSYVTLPLQKDLPTTKNSGDSKGSHLYAIGGRGEIQLAGKTGNDMYRFVYENCYCLSSCLIDEQGNYRDIGAPGVSEASFAELSAGGSAYEALLAAGFDPVTTTTSTGDPIDGRYSFGTDRSLLGTNYPFPTILTQSSDLVEGGLAHVHYGDWAVQGILRENGALPVQMDLFADYQAGAGAVRSEELTLSNLSGSGSWSAASADPAVATASLAHTQAQGGTNTLTIKAQAAGSTQVTITYTESGQTYTLTIDVNVTADLRLSADSGVLEMFVQEESAQAALHWTNAEGKALPETLTDGIAVSEFSASYDMGRFASASVAEEDGSIVLTASTLSEDGPAQMTVTYTFTYLGQTYTASSVLSLDVHPGFALTPVEAAFAGSQSQQTIFYDGAQIGSIQVGGQQVTVTDVTITGFEDVEGFREQIFAQWADEAHGQLEIEVSPPDGVTEMTAYLRVQLRFTYGGCTHTLWQNLPIHITTN